MRRETPAIKNTAYNAAGRSKKTAPQKTPPTNWAEFGQESNVSRKKNYF
jgi:hypothetical protein